MLLGAYATEGRDVQKMLSLFGCLGPSSQAKTLLRELRAEEEAEPLTPAP